MAEAKNEKKTNRVVQAVLHEWKYENLILVILALFAIELGVLLLYEGAPITLTENEFFAKGHNAAIFSWILVGLGAISLVLAVSGFYRPSFEEIKHVSGLSGKEFLSNIIIVVVFSLIVALIIFGFDQLINVFIKLIEG